MSTVINNDGNTAKPGSIAAQTVAPLPNQINTDVTVPQTIKIPTGVQTQLDQQKQATLQNIVEQSQKQQRIQKATNVMNGVGTALNAVASFMPERDSLSGQYGNLSQSTESMVDSLGGQLPGIWGAAYSMLNGASDIAAGMFGDTLTTSGNSKSDAIMDAIPGLGLLNAGLGNAIGNNKIDNLNYDQETWGTVGGSYAGSQSAVKDAADNTGGRYGILSKLTGEFKKDQDQNRAAQITQDMVSKIGDEAKAAQEVASSTLQEAILNERKRLQGTNLSLRVQKGMKLPTKQDIQKTKQLFKEPEFRRPSSSPNYSILFKQEDTIEEIDFFKEGGKMNIIPEGELHARLHHMEQDGITKKGIPVISIEEGGEVVQHAEIERNEIIFHLELTKKLEELMEDGSDEAAIEAGKLLVDEILNNTEDRTGLLNEVE